MIFVKKTLIKSKYLAATKIFLLNNMMILAFQAKHIDSRSIEAIGTTNILIF